MVGRDLEALTNLAQRPPIGTMAASQEVALHGDVVPWVLDCRLEANAPCAAGGKPMCERAWRRDAADHEVLGVEPQLQNLELPDSSRLAPLRRFARARGRAGAPLSDVDIA